MIYITDPKDKTKYHSWHVGEPLPQVLSEGRVIEIQADGNELEMILHAMKATRKGK